MTALNTFSDVLRHAVKNGYKTEYTELMLQAAELLDAKVYTRPAAPVEGLETKGYMRPEDRDQLSFWVSKNQNAYYREPVVTRSQAEAIIAAGRAQTDAYGIALMMIREGCENPSLVARNALERFSK